MFWQNVDIYKHWPKSPRLFNHTTNIEHKTGYYAETLLQTFKSVFWAFKCQFGEKITSNLYVHNQNQTPTPVLWCWTICHPTIDLLIMWSYYACSITRIRSLTHNLHILFAVFYEFLIPLVFQITTTLLTCFVCKARL